MSETIFQSYFMGGFECSTHRDRSGRRLDLIEATRHDVFAFQDYIRLREIGIDTCRDGLRWHLIEKEPFKYDFTSAELQVEAARKTGIQVIWDYFHYGYPDDLDIFSPDFIERYSAFSRAATEYLRSEFGNAPLICPVNEISFFSWIAGSVGHFYPCAQKRGTTLKRQLVRAGVASIDSIRAVCPDARTIITDPAIHVVAQSDSINAKRAAERYRRSQFQAYDMLAGRIEPELGGGEQYLDILGLNYYFHNQWHHPSRKKIPPGHDVYRPLSEILFEFHARYDRPMIIAETGIEDDERPSWFRYVCEQTAVARTSGVEAHGICLYPIVNHPGWADDRHCHNGLWDYPDETGGRQCHEPLLEEIRYQSAQAAASVRSQKFSKS